MNKYGCREISPLPEGYHQKVTEQIDYSAPVYWTAPGLTITRFRLLCDRLGGVRVMDVSYCHGEIDGAPVLVHLPFHQLTAPRWKSEVIEAARADRVYAKALKIFEAASILY